MHYLRQKISCSITYFYWLKEEKRGELKLTDLLHPIIDKTFLKIRMFYQYISHRAT